MGDRIGPEHALDKIGVPPKEKQSSINSKAAIINGPSIIPILAAAKFKLGVPPPFSFL